ncbi:MAG: hypothetical protein JXA57_18805 [Armatimonadetes bacterium]|nr:hypothetical protein [Armatimonadota bacterium]
MIEREGDTFGEEPEAWWNKMSEPVIHALLMADRVIREDNGKVGVIGIFTNFNFASFPATPPPWFLYAFVSNLEGGHDFSFNLVEKDTSMVVLSVGGRMQIKEPKEGITISLPVANVSFPKAGIYTLVFSIDGHEVAYNKLRASLIPRKIEG